MNIYSLGQEAHSRSGTSTKPWLSEEDTTGPSTKHSLVRNNETNKTEEEEEEDPDWEPVQPELHTVCQKWKSPVRGR